MIQGRYQQEYYFTLKRMCIGGVFGGIFLSAAMFLYLYLSDFFTHNCCPGEFDYLPNSVYVFMGLLFFGCVGGSLGCLLSLFSKKRGEFKRTQHINDQ